MYEQEFKKLLIDTIRVGDNPDKDKIISLLKISVVRFENEEIQDAKYVIWIAMAWFTDPVLYKELLKKKNKGVTIEIVVDDNDKNRNAEFDLGTSFSTHWVTIESLYKNIMHEKFCIIDLHTVIHGTFNWTKAANYNKETISIDRNRVTAETFADEFIRLKKVTD